MAIYQIDEFSPQIDPSVFVAGSANVIGKVHLAAHSSVWFDATLRGDNELISIGENSNVQDSAVLHTDMDFPLTIGRDVTIGHQAMLHGCTVQEGALIGIQAIILNGAVIGKNCLVGAGALVTEGKQFPDNALIIGAPAKAVRMLTEEEINRMCRNTDHYVQRARLFKTKLVRLK
jgi:carbonic anhydrase/acetyltransferase-like protein (isoleucine patch superfamily)